MRKGAWNSSETTRVQAASLLQLERIVGLAAEQWCQHQHQHQHAHTADGRGLAQGVFRSVAR